MPTFPISGQIVSRDGYNEGILNDPTIRSNMDSGEPKARPRFSAVCRTQTGQINGLTSTQVDSIFTFYDTTCAYGSLSFTWTHPRTAVSGTFKWQKRPEVIGTDGVLFTMSIAIMQLPA